MRVLLGVAAGGGAGCLARWLVTDGRSPWVTVLVNVTGAFALGLLLARTREGSILRPVLGTGFLGGWTTWSALAAQSAGDLRGAAYSSALMLLVVSVVAGPTSAWVGTRLGRLARVQDEVP